jgi:hypothetical protein
MLLSLCQQIKTDMIQTINVKELSNAITAYKSCKVSGNVEWAEKHLERIENLCDALPCGSGFDAGTEILLDKCTPDKLVFYTQFHHLSDGYYVGWTKHNVIIEPSFSGFNIRISGRNYNDIKDYIYDVFADLLSL